MAGTVDRIRDETYRRLCAAATSLLARGGVAGVWLVDDAGALVLRFGAGPFPDDEATLARLAAAAGLAAGLDRERSDTVPVYVQDAGNRVYARPLVPDLVLMVGCAPDWPAGLIYRLVDGPAEVMREVLTALFEADDPGPEAPGPDGPTRDTPPPDAPGSGGDDPDVYWERG